MERLVESLYLIIVLLAIGGAFYVGLKIGVKLGEKGEDLPTFTPRNTRSTSDIRKPYKPSRKELLSGQPAGVEQPTE